MTDLIRFHCDGCGKLRLVRDRKVKFVLGRRTFICAKCAEFQNRVMSIRKEHGPKLYKPEEKAKGHTPHNNSVPKLPGSLKRGKPTGETITPPDVKITVCPRYPDRFPDELGEGYFTNQWKELRK